MAAPRRRAVRQHVDQTVGMNPQTATAAPGIRTVSRPACAFCGTEGRLLHAALTDALYGAPGVWNLRRCAAPDCGLVWLDPYPAAEDLGKVYEGYHTHDPAPAQAGQSRVRRLIDRLTGSRTRGLADFVQRAYLAHRFGYGRERFTQLQTLAGVFVHARPTRRADLDFSVMLIPAMPGGRLLDVGCGNGSFIARMHELGWDVAGTDVDADAVRRARLDSGLDVYEGTLEGARFPVGSFDVVTLTHVVEHVDDPVALLAECRRILRPGGRVVATTPNVESWGHAIFGAAWRGLEPPRHLMLFSVRTMAVCARRAGLRITALRTTARGAKFFYLAGQKLAGKKQKPRIAFWFQMLEELARPAFPRAAEEIYFVGTKE